VARDDRRRQAYRITETLIRSDQGGARPSGWRPNVDVYENDTGIVVALDLPGVSPESIDISVSGRRLAVTGHRAPVVRRGARRIHHMEIPHGPFEVVLDLPGPVDTAASDASWTNGMLEIVLPFPSPVRPTIRPRSRAEGRAT
jgi:HSP20 family protein